MVLNGYHLSLPRLRKSVSLQDAADGGALKSAKDVLDKVMDAWQLRLWGILAAVLNGLGNLAEFLGGQAAGYAAAAMVQSFPMVSFVAGQTSVNSLGWWCCMNLVTVLV